MTRAMDDLDTGALPAGAAPAGWAPAALAVPAAALPSLPFAPPCGAASGSCAGPGSSAVLLYSSRNLHASLTRWLHVRCPGVRFPCWHQVRSTRAVC